MPQDYNVHMERAIDKEKFKKIEENIRDIMKRNEKPYNIREKYMREKV